MADGTFQFAVIDVRRPADRILDEIETQFAAAAELIGVPELVPIAVYHRSVAGRLTTITPCLLIVEKGTEESIGDHLAGAMIITYELMIDGPDPERLVTDIAHYAFLISTILANLSRETFAAADGRHQNFWLSAINSSYEPLGRQGDLYRQVLQLRATFQIKASPAL